MPNEPTSPRLQHRWIFPVLAGLVALSLYQGIRMDQDRREAVQEQYAESLAAFGETDADGEPRLNPELFALHGSTAVKDVTAILNDPEANDLAKIQAMHVLTLILGEEAAPILIERIEKESPAVREEALRLLEETGGPEANGKP